jgi:group I intron endonuclease
MTIYKALLKYGSSSFKLEILEYCDPNVVLDREQQYLDSLRPEYNILKVAGSLLGYKHTGEAKAKMSQSALNRSSE